MMESRESQAMLSLSCTLVYQYQGSKEMASGVQVRFFVRSEVVVVVVV
jgi:hypothetical protein